MKFEPIENGRAHMMRTDQGLFIEVPAPRAVFVSMFLLFWLCGWAIGELLALGTVVAMFTSGSFFFAALFILVWLGAWTVGGFFAIRAFLWLAFGKEQIVVTPEAVSVTRHYGVWFKEKVYDALNINNLRVVVSEGDKRPANAAFLGAGQNAHSQGSVKFDYGKQLRGFGIALDVVEATIIVEEISVHLRPSN